MLLQNAINVVMLQIRIQTVRMMLVICFLYSAKIAQQNIIIVAAKNVKAQFIYH